MQGVRGKNKTPGEFRKSQNWIGGTMPSTAVYVRTKTIIETMYNEPILNRNQLSEITNMNITTIKRIVNTLVQNDILIETTGFSRNQIFAFQKYIDLFLK